MKKLLVSLVAAFGVMAGAQAASYQDVVSGTGAVSDYSTEGLISFDLVFNQLGTTTFSYVIDAADSVGLSFNALLKNMTGYGITGYNFMISGGEFAYSGTFSSQWFNYTENAYFNGTSASVGLLQPEFNDVEIGDPLMNAGGKFDWAINGLSAGDVLTVSVTAVPEPESIAMLLAGLGAVGVAARRRQKKQG